MTFVVPAAGESESTAPSQAVLEAVAAAESVDPADLEWSLYDVLDPDALDRLFAGRDGGVGEVRFTYHGYDVTVTSDGRVELASPARGGSTV